MINDPLAIHGGPKALPDSPAERWRTICDSDIESVVQCLSRQVNTNADGSGIVQEFERAFADLCQTQYALTMNTGTASLHSAYFAVGVKPGTEVIVPPYTYFATVAPILQCGGRPVFCDIDSRTLTLDPDQVEHHVTAKTRAICAVHVWGNPAAVDRLRAIADRNGVALIEDCSHAHGASYQGRPVGSWGDIGCFSLQGEKAVSGGEAGVAVTDDPVLFDRMLALGHNSRTYRGQIKNTFSIDDMSLGLKFRPHVLAIILAHGSLQRLPRLNQLRGRNYEILCQHLKDCPALQPIASYPQAVRGGFLQFILRYDASQCGGWNRYKFVRVAAAEGVPVAVDRYTRFLLHQSPLFQEMDFSKVGGYLGADWQPGKDPRSNLPVAERARHQLVTVPAFTDVDEDYVERCAKALGKVVDHARHEASKRPAAGRGDCS